MKLAHALMFEGNEATAAVKRHELKQERKSNWLRVGDRTVGTWSLCSHGA